MSSEDYATIRQIGKGAFGTAHIVQHKVTGERFVLKRVRLARQSAKERQCSVRELLLLSNLRHRNVLEFKGCWLEGGCNLCMLVELCESGDLFTQLQLRAPSGVHFSEEHLQEMAVQLLSAVDYLHRSGIAHRDIKSSNVLITGEGCLRLADFGLSLVVDTEAGGMTKTMVGTPNYMSPDVLQDRPYLPCPNDIWGLGCVLFELSALKPAFQAFNMAGLVKKVTTAPAPQLPSCYSETWRSLVRSMLTKEAGQRPTASELLAQPCLQAAAVRVEARFGPALPPGCPDPLDAHSSLAALPPDLMALLEGFMQQEREEKRREDAAKARRKAALAKWDPVARQAEAARKAEATKAARLPPLKPHQPRQRPPQPQRGQAAAKVPPLVPCGGGKGAAAGAGKVVGAAARRQTYSGDCLVAAAGTGAGARAGGAVAAGRGRTGAAGALPPHKGPAVAGGRGQAAAGAAAGSKPVAIKRVQPPGLQLAGHASRPSTRPSSAPPDSPMRRQVHYELVPSDEGETEGEGGGSSGSVEDPHAPDYHGHQHHQQQPAREGAGLQEGAGGLSRVLAVEFSSMSMVGFGDPGGAGPSNWGLERVTHGHEDSSEDEGRGDSGEGHAGAHSGSMLHATVSCPAASFPLAAAQEHQHQQQQAHTHGPAPVPPTGSAAPADRAPRRLSASGSTDAGVAGGSSANKASTATQPTAAAVASHAAAPGPRPPSAGAPRPPAPAAPAAPGGAATATGAAAPQRRASGTGTGSRPSSAGRQGCGVTAAPANAAKVQI